MLFMSLHLFLYLSLIILTCQSTLYLRHGSLRVTHDVLVNGNLTVEGNIFSPTTNAVNQQLESIRFDVDQQRVQHSILHHHKRNILGTFPSEFAQGTYELPVLIDNRPNSYLNFRILDQSSLYQFDTKSLDWVLEDSSVGISASNYHTLCHSKSGISYIFGEFYWFLYDHRSSSWDFALSTSNGPDLTSRRHTVVTCEKIQPSDPEETIVAYGGLISSTPTDTLHTYSYANDSWTPLTSSGTPGAFFAYGFYEGVMWTAMETTALSPDICDNTITRFYNFDTSSWSSSSLTGDTVAPRTRFTTVYRDNYCFLLGGLKPDLSENFDDFVKFEFDKQTMTVNAKNHTITPTLTPGRHFTLGLSQNVLFVWGGQDNSNTHLDDMFVIFV